VVPTPEEQSSPPPAFPPPYAVDVALSQRSHERIGERRTDDAWLDEQWADPATRVLVLAGGRFPLTDDRSQVRWMSPEEAPEGDHLLLGERHGTVHFAVLPTGFRAPESWAQLREVGQELPAEDRGFVVQALAMWEWRRAHRFCGRCGGGLVADRGGYVMQCESCRRLHFPRTDPAVIMLVTDGERALLGRQAVWPEGRFSTLAGFVDPGESLEDAVAREVKEEAGIEVTDVTYFGNQPWPFPSSLMVGFFARAVTTDISVDDDELEHARWFTREELRQESEAGTLALPGGFSISRSLIEAWYGGPLPGRW
jgi:NAD+ diphosphatase